MIQKRGFGLTTSEPKTVGRRFELLKPVKWIVTIVASAAAGYFVCVLTPTSQQPDRQAAAEQGDPPRRPFPHRPTPVDLTSAEFRRLKREALRGSKEAALAVMTAYEECVPPRGTGSELDKAFIAECDRSFKHWVNIAATNGVAEAANLVFNELSASDRCEDIYRARFWTRRMPWWGREPWIAADTVLRDKERRCGW